MLTLKNLLLFIPTMGLLIILPGPDFALVSKISIFQGKRHGEFAAAGVAVGMCVHTLLAMFGISAIVATSATLFMILKYAGAAYLCFLGINSVIQSFRAGNTTPLIAACEETEKKVRRLKRSFWAGFLTNVLNPKAILYFMVLLPQFITTDRPLAGQFLQLGLISAFLCIAWYLFLANLLARVRNIFTSASFQRWLSRITGGIFILFGARLAMEKME